MQPFTVEAAMAMLIAAFPKSRLAEPTIVLYYDALRPLTDAARRYAVDLAIRSHRGSTVPPIGTLLAHASAAPKPNPLPQIDSGPWEDPRRPLQRGRIHVRDDGTSFDEADLIGRDGVTRGFPNAVYERARQAAIDRADAHYRAVRARWARDDAAGIQPDPRRAKDTLPGGKRAVESWEADENAPRGNPEHYLGIHRGATQTIERVAAGIGKVLDEEVPF